MKALRKLQTNFKLLLMRRKLFCLILCLIWIYLLYHIHFGGNPKEDSPKARVDLLLILFSAPDNYFRRNAIRNSWLKNHFPGVKHLFSIGAENLSPNALTSLNKESDQHQDIMLLDIAEGYEKLSTKLMESIKYACNGFEFQYLFKGDDDTFVNMKAMLDEISSKRKDRLYWGFFDGRANVKKTGRWSEPNWILCDRYLPHARGGGYVITSDLARFVERNEDFLTRYRSEDVSMGAWLGALDIERLHDSRFDTEYKSRGCNDDYIVTHKVSAKNMLLFQENLERSGRLCEREIRLRLSYNYDWRALPSNCCIRNDSSIP